VLARHVRKDDEPSAYAAWDSPADRGLGRAAGGEQPAAAGRPGAGPVRADAGLAVRVPSRVGRHHGPGLAATPDAGLRVHACGDAGTRCYLGLLADTDARSPRPESVRA
jgi:hypothetical protein